MSFKKTFSLGGIHPPENKITATKSIISAQLPDMVYISVNQHIGTPAKIVVKKGDSVKVGTLLGQADGFVSANIHSPVSGLIEKIEDTPSASGYYQQTIHIKVQEDIWEDYIIKDSDLNRDIESHTKEDIVARVKESGIVGLGGAAFPTHVKLFVPEGKSPKALLINAAECEPYLTADHSLLLEKADEILVGIALLMKALAVQKAFIGIESNKKDAIKLITPLCSKYSGIEVVPLKVKYPQGGEKQLIRAISGKEVPSGKLPLDIGYVVSNVSTAFAIYEALQKNKPLIERVVTVTGKRLEAPSNMKVRIGTRFSYLLEQVGGLPSSACKVIAGGPMMGRAVASVDAVVSKGTSGILILDEKETKRAKEQNCIRCASCVSVCPMGLEPYLLKYHGQHSMHENAQQNYILDCIECGSCSYSCPANIPLLDYIKVEKNSVIQINRSKNLK
ncbi:MAG: electron transport complex subunit RsxC [Bacteroidales bacterium]|nr:electron transport complex subunit RsxC [Bacteroidales bacterium]